MVLAGISLPVWPHVVSIQVSPGMTSLVAPRLTFVLVWTDMFALGWPQLVPVGVTPGSILPVAPVLKSVLV